MSIIKFNDDLMASLSDEAKLSSRRRKHKNLHGSYQEACQRFFNAIEPDSYLRPHCHGSSQGVETLIAVRGLLAFFYFEETGNIYDIQLFGAGVHAGKNDVVIGVEVKPGQWHTVVSLESGSVLLELKGGPFNPESPKYFAPWAPEELTQQGQIYLKELKKYIKFS